MSSPPPPFQRFLDANSEAVWRFLLRSVGPTEADDCFQETFIAALRAYPRLRHDSNLRAWVLTIAHRKALDAHRSRARRPLPVGEPVDVAELGERGGHRRRGGSGGQGGLGGGPDSDPGAPAVRDRELWEAVRQLPARQRSAVVLRYLADLPHRDIAAAIGCSEAAARRSLHEGLTRLRMGELA